jgi:hypothetical protein
MIWKKIPVEKNSRPGGVETFPADLMIFREIRWGKNGCQTGAMSTSSGF